ncbi:hypothetical protein BJX96DRAFT_21529 [Aspergillus floccosus]
MREIRKKESKMNLIVVGSVVPSAKGNLIDPLFFLPFCFQIMREIIKDDLIIIIFFFSLSLSLSFPSLFSDVRAGDCWRLNSPFSRQSGDQKTSEPTTHQNKNNPSRGSQQSPRSVRNVWQFQRASQDVHPTMGRGRSAMELEITQPRERWLTRALNSGHDIQD